MDSDTNSADYETVKDHYIHTEPVQEYYVTPRAANEGAVEQDRESKRIQYFPVQQKGSVVQWIALIIVLLISICALGSSIGAFLNGVKHGNELKKTSTQFVRTATDVLAKLNNASSAGSCDECVRRSDQDVYHMSTSQALNSLQNLYHELNRTVQELNTQYQLEKNYTQQKIMSGSVDLSVGCTAITSTCVLNHNNVGTPPTSLTCETPEHPLEEPGFRNVNIYCSVDNSVAEINPVTSTLNIYNGEVSCLCALVALTVPIASVACRMTIQRCPKSVMFNTTNTRYHDSLN